MCEIKPVWSADYLIHSYEVDLEGRVTVPNLCRYLQETAYYHAEHLGVGHSALSKNNRVWMLLGLAVRIERYPRWNDTITVKTWPSRKDRIYYYRDFRMLAKDIPVGSATTKWITVDLDKRRPCRADLDFHIQYDEMEKVWPEALEKIPDSESKSILATVEVKYHDLDVNDHVNNIRYVEWILDGFSRDFYQISRLEEFEIFFQAEAVFGDKILLMQTESEPDRFLHSLTHQKEGKEVCRARSVWQKTTGKNRII
jgi:medium-chain acyl-[acyl-carrier-protein] hydrolase